MNFNAISTDEVTDIDPLTQIDRELTQLNIVCAKILTNPYATLTTEEQKLYFKYKGQQVPGRAAQVSKLIEFIEKNLK